MYMWWTLNFIHKHTFTITLLLCLWCYDGIREKGAPYRLEEERDVNRLNYSLPTMRHRDKRGTISSPVHHSQGNRWIQKNRVDPPWEAVGVPQIYAPRRKDRQSGINGIPQGIDKDVLKGGLQVLGRQPHKGVAPDQEGRRRNYRITLGNVGTPMRGKTHLRHQDRCAFTNQGRIPEIQSRWRAVLQLPKLWARPKHMSRHPQMHKVREEPPIEGLSMGPSHPGNVRKLSRATPGKLLDVPKVASSL